MISDKGFSMKFESYKKDKKGEFLKGKSKKEIISLYNFFLKNPSISGDYITLDNMKMYNSFKNDVNELYDQLEKEEKNKEINKEIKQISNEIDKEKRRKKEEEKIDKELSKLDNNISDDLIESIINIGNDLIEDKNLLHDKVINNINKTTPKESDTIQEKIEVSPDNVNKAPENNGKIYIYYYYYFN